MSPLNK